jgi:hypothetical protein
MKIKIVNFKEFILSSVFSTQLSSNVASCAHASDHRHNRKLVARLLNKSSPLAVALGVTKFETIADI